MKVLYPELLFDGQKVYGISSNVDKLGMSAASSDMLVIYEADSDIPAEQLQMIEKMVAACKVDAAKVRYLGVSKSESIALSQLIKHYNPSFILIFGQPPVRSNMNQPFMNHPFNIGTCTIMRTDTVANVFLNKGNAKVPLWMALKTFFNV